MIKIGRGRKGINRMSKIRRYVGRKEKGKVEKGR